jgi:hypothetical protein
VVCEPCEGACAKVGSCGGRYAFGLRDARQNTRRDEQQLGERMFYLGLVLAASVFTSSDPRVDAQQFERLIKALHADYQDISLIAEGTRSYVGPTGAIKREGKYYSQTYQTFFVVRNDGSCFQDLYLRSEVGDGLLQRSTKSLLKGKLETLRTVPDLNRSSRSSANGQASVFFDKGSPARILFLWYFLTLKEPADHGYEFRGWEDVDGHNCLCVRLFLGPVRPDAEKNGLFYHLFWIDMHRGGHVLRYEYKLGQKLHSRVDGVKLQLLPTQDGKSVWIPVQGEYNCFCFGTDSFYDVPLFRETYHVVGGSTLLNQGLSDRQFSVDWNWSNATETEEMKSTRRKKVALSPLSKTTTNSPNLKKRLDHALAEADSQSRRLEASSVTRAASSWTPAFQLAGFIAGLGMLVTAAWYKLRTEK